MSKIYVAGKWSEKTVIRERMKELECMGYTITHDWTSFESDENNTKQSMADKDIDGVCDADIYIGLFEDSEYAYRGTFTEMGMAIASKRMNPNYMIYAVCPFYLKQMPIRTCTTNCFFHATCVTHIKSWDEMKNELKNM